MLGYRSGVIIQFEHRESRTVSEYNVFKTAELNVVRAMAVSQDRYVHRMKWTRRLGENLKQKQVRIARLFYRYPLVEFFSINVIVGLFD